MELYDKGEEKAFLELFKIFAIEKYQAEEDRIGILGMTPQDVSDLDAADKYVIYISRNMANRQSVTAWETDWKR